MRYVLIDFMHLAYRTVVMEPLTSTLMIDGVVQEVETTVPYYTIKTIYRYSKSSKNSIDKTAICFEGRKNKRKDYFSEGTPNEGEYKGGRTKFYPLVRGAELTKSILKESGASVYSAEGYEADDCIYTLVESIKRKDPDYDILIYTNDADLLPLVEERVSVFMRGTRQHSERGYSEQRLYYQVTPETWDEYMTYTSAFKGYNLPYNSVILFKMIRGDKADNIKAAVTGYGPVKFRKLLEEMKEDGVNFANTFRYNKDFDKDMRPILANYFTEEELDSMRYVYNGLRLRIVVGEENLERIKEPSVLDVNKLGQAGFKYGIKDFYRL